MTCLIAHDLHCHTNLSPCASRDCTLEELVERSRSAGLKLVGITDHIHTADEGQVRALVALAERVHRGDWPIEVRVGAEVTLLDEGRPAVEPGRLRLLDFFNIAPNHLGLPGVPEPERWEAGVVADWLLDRFASAVELRPLAVSHPLIHGWPGRVPQPALLAALDGRRLARILERAAHLGVAVELNARKVPAAPSLFRAVIRLGREVGLRFTVGTDAHTPEEMGYGGPAGRERFEGLLRRLGLTPDLLLDPLRPAAVEGGGKGTTR